MAETPHTPGYSSLLLSLSDIDQVKTILCPSKNCEQNLFKACDAIENNESLPEYPTWDPGSSNPIVDYNDQDDTQGFSDVTFASDFDFFFI